MAVATAPLLVVTFEPPLFRSLPDRPFRLLQGDEPAIGWCEWVLCRWDELDIDELLFAWQAELEVAWLNRLEWWPVELASSAGLVTFGVKLRWCGCEWYIEVIVLRVEFECGMRQTADGLLWEVLKLVDKFRPGKQVITQKADHEKSAAIRGN